MRGKMKGLGYELMMFGACFILLTFVWIFGYGVFAEITTVFTNISTNSTIDGYIMGVSNVVYWSFYIIVLFGILWLVKEAKKDERQAV